MSQNSSLTNFQASDKKAIAYLLLPLSFGTLGLLLPHFLENVFIYLLAQLMLGLFFFQCFILLHECGHFSFFKNRKLNLALGHLFSFLSFIPFTSWVSIHNLHHKWTGYRDKDPTTEGTVNPPLNPYLKKLINLCWLLWIPLFSLAYRYENYWSPNKLKRFVNDKKLSIIKTNKILLLVIYIALIIFSWKYLLVFVLPAYLLSLVISDIFILSQHSHIPIPLAGTQPVKPIKYIQQIAYTRSLHINSIVARFLFLNFNQHELHHACPGVPAYYLDQLRLETPNTVEFFSYLRDAKSMKGLDFIFSVSDKKPGTKH